MRGGWYSEGGITNFRVFKGRFVKVCQYVNMTSFVITAVMMNFVVSVFGLFAATKLVITFIVISYFPILLEQQGSAEHMYKYLVKL